MGSWANLFEHGSIAPSTTERYLVTSGCWLWQQGHLAFRRSAKVLRFAGGKLGGQKSYNNEIIHPLTFLLAATRPDTVSCRD